MKNFTVTYTNDYGERVTKTINANSREEISGKLKKTFIGGGRYEWNGNSRDISINERSRGW